MSVKIRKAMLMPVLIAGLAFFMPWVAAGQEGEAYAEEIVRHRMEKDEKFRDPRESPLDKKGIRKFRGLNYFPPDEKYRVAARFIVNEMPVLFKMPTTTTRLPEYIKYGELEFELDGNTYRLEVYRNSEINRKPGYEDYLFVPFTDDTNGEETYEMGRYLDFRVPATDEVVLDFNLAYNPYCCYSDNFSCPIPPAANRLALAVRAGEKK